MKANSLLYAPSFAGGDKAEALSLFLTLLEAGSSNLNTWDLSSIYVGIGRICMDRNEWDKALGYFTAARALYAFDPPTSMITSGKQRRGYDYDSLSYCRYHWVVCFHPNPL